MYYSFRYKKELKNDNPLTYRGKLEESGVLEVVNKNHLLVEPFAALLMKHLKEKF